MQQKNKKTCEKPKAEREEDMKHTEDLHIHHKIDEEYTKNTLKTENRRKRKPMEGEKLKVETEKRLERDRQETGVAQEAQRELDSELRRKS